MHLPQVSRSHDADARALSETRYADAPLFDRPDNLVAWDDARMLRRQVALADVQVGAAYAAGADAHQDLVGLRLRNGRLDVAKRSRFNQPGLKHGHRFHGFAPS